MRGALVTLGLALAAARLAAAPDATEPAAQADPAFAVNLYRELSLGDGNVVFSPYSVSLALALAETGARGKTAEEMALVLHLAPPGRTAETFGALQMAIERDAGPGVALVAADSLWCQQGYDLDPSFLDRIRHGFGAEVEFANFHGQPEPSAEAINQWVRQKTEGKIDQLIRSENINSLTRLVLVNAVYFRGRWASPFKSRLTRSDVFILKNYSTVLVPTMHQRGLFAYAEGDHFKLLGLPYQGGRLSMILILPDTVTGLQELEHRLTPENFQKWAADLGQRSLEVTVSLPRFSFQTRSLLSAALIRLGMVDAFRPEKADFSGMDGKRDLYLSQVIHKAFIRVDETGTEAAAAGGSIMAGAVAVAHPLEFKADHPFLFALRDNRTGELLFLGRVVDPR